MLLYTSTGCFFVVIKYRISRIGFYVNELLLESYYNDDDTEAVYVMMTQVLEVLGLNGNVQLVVI